MQRKSIQIDTKSIQSYKTIRNQQDAVQNQHNMNKFQYKFSRSGGLVEEQKVCGGARHDTGVELRPLPQLSPDFLAGWSSCG